MRDQRFVAEHRGGPLSKARHYQLMHWACDCAEHVLPLYGKRIDVRLIHALTVARAWTRGEVSTGEARQAAMGAIHAARAASQPAAVAVARGVGHAVATAHMADHALGPAWYGLKAVKAAGRSVEEERAWQNTCIPSGIRMLVLSARKLRKI